VSEVKVSSRRWERFDKAVYEFVHEWANAERNKAGCLAPPVKGRGKHY
jgi:hypothetical protein